MNIFTFQLRGEFILTLYGFVVLIHVLSAVVGLGASFTMPAIIKGAKTADQARFTLNLFKRIEKPIKFGSLLLLLTGLILGVLNTSLFTTGWYITSLIIYLLTMPISAGVLPKKVKRMHELLNEHKDENLPEAYVQTANELTPFVWSLHIAVIVLVTLMTVKPF